MNFRDLKNKIKNPSSILPKEEKKVLSEKPLESLEVEEARYLLNLIASTDFKGKDVQMVYNIALKLQNIITLHLDKNE